MKGKVEIAINETQRVRLIICARWLVLEVMVVIVGEAITYGGKRPYQ